MSIGTVKWFDSKKGFGFIVNPEGKDVFVHFSSIEGDGFRSLKDGEKVEYDQIEGEKGLSAKGVRRVGGPSVPAGSATGAVAGAINGAVTGDGEARMAQRPNQAAAGA
jgi:CspA family cold shock protein